MVGETIVMSIELVGGTTLVLTIGALTAAASRLRSWISSRNPAGLAPAEEAAQPIVQVHAQIDPYRDAAGDGLLAQALGVSLSRLRRARDYAHSKILSHLISEGLVAPTEGAQKESDGDGVPAPYVLAAPSRERSGDEAPFLAYLAEGLGITIFELQEAREAALEQALTSAVETGSMTEAHMEDRLMRFRAQPYIDPTGLLAESLDITLEELEQTSLDAWLARRQLTWRALTARLAAAREDALAQAVLDGQIDRQEADRLLAEATWSPLLTRKAVRMLPKPSPRYGFLYLHDADEILN